MSEAKELAMPEYAEALDKAGFNLEDWEDLSSKAARTPEEESRLIKYEEILRNVE